MPGKKPLRDAILQNTLDFNNQGITGAQHARKLAVTTSASATYVMSDTDIFSIVNSTYAGTTNFVISAGLTGPIGGEVLFYNSTSGGAIAVSASGAATILAYGSTATAGRYAAAGAICVASNTWLITGNMS